MPNYYPGTSYPVSHSFEDAIFNVEFDDALCDQAAWKNSRYDGSRLKALEINKFTPSSSVGGPDGWDGDQSYQGLPVLNSRTTALYIANTVVGGDEDPQFATIKKHSYVGINKILLIRPEDESVQIIDKQVEPWSEFHRFVTTDFPAGSKARVKIIDESIATNLQPEYRVRMNKGWLLKTFDFEHGGEYSGSAEHKSVCLVENNSMYLYRSGSIEFKDIATGSSTTSYPEMAINNKLRFRYGVIEMHHKNSTGNSSRLFMTESGQYMCDRLGPSFASSSIHKNKFSEQYYSGSYRYVLHQTPSITLMPSYAFDAAIKYHHVLNSTAFASASRFIGVDSLDFLSSHNSTTTSSKDQTELHITFLEGTKDFAPGFHDERSISTFEIDENRGQALGDFCNSRLPTHHELILKGHDDGRFLPTTDSYFDDINSAYPMWTGSGGTALGGGAYQADSNPNDTPSTTEANNHFGCNEPGEINEYSIPQLNILPHGLGRDSVTDMDVYVQGGALGEVGIEGLESGSASTYTNSQLDKMTADNFYSGSFSYEISFLDKDHTLIMNIDKDAELFDGIGEKGLVIIPNHISPQVSFNIEYYLQKAGIIDSTTNITQNISPETQTE